MAPTIPTQVFIQDANGNIIPFQIGGDGPTVNVNIVDRSDAVLHFTTGTVASLGDNTALGAPGSGLQYVISKLHIQNVGGSANTITVKFGSESVWKAYCAASGGGVVLDFGAPDRMACGDNQPLLLNLSAAVSTIYSVAWYAVAV